jgi:hemerythrin superfamily protein
MPNVIEETISKVAGKLGEAKAIVTGLQGVFRQLTLEHKEVAVLLARAAMSSDGDKRAELWTGIRQMLTAHEEAEELVIYGELDGRPELEDLVKQHRSEATQLEAFMQNVDLSLPDTVLWEGSLKQLREAVLRHAHEEEAHLFPRLQKELGVEWARQVARRYESVRARRVRPVTLVKRSPGEE